MNKISAYQCKYFKDIKDVMCEWDYNEIEMDYAKWKQSMNWIKIYIFSNAGPTLSTHTKMGSGADPEMKLEKLNEKEIKAFKDKKRNYGFSKPMFFLIVPPYRNYHCSMITNNCRMGRGWESRCKIALKFVFSMGLEFRIHRNVMDETSVDYNQSISESIQSYCAEKGVPIYSLFIKKNFGNHDHLEKISEELCQSKKRLSVKKTIKKKKKKQIVLNGKE